MTIHILHSGFALCGLTGLPRDWPDGHRWVGTWALGSGVVEQSCRPDCAECLRVAKEKELTHND
jgi:hypothetical protein